MVFGQESDEQVGLPLPVLAVIPSHANGEQTHIAGKLETVQGRNQCLPMLAVTVYPLVVAAIARGIEHHIHIVTVGYVNITVNIRSHG